MTDWLMSHRHLLHQICDIVITLLAYLNVFIIRCAIGFNEALAVALIGLMSIAYTAYIATLSSLAI